jgi:hypothetical protein
MKKSISFENLAQLKYLRMPATNQNLIQELIKWRLNSGNACFHSGQNLLSSRLTYLLAYSVALVRKRTISTEQPPLVDEVSANFCR